MRLCTPSHTLANWTSSIRVPCPSCSGSSFRIGSFSTTSNPSTDPTHPPESRSNTRTAGLDPDLPPSPHNTLHQTKQPQTHSSMNHNNGQDSRPSPTQA